MPENTVPHNDEYAQKASTITENSACYNTLYTLPRPWRKYHADALSTVHEFALAIGQHRDLQNDIGQCRAAVADALQAAYTRRRARGEEVPPHGPFIDRDLTDLASKALSWVMHRYWRIVRDARDRIDLAPMDFQYALELAMKGVWDDAVACLESVVSHDYQGRHSPVRVDLVRGEQDARALAELWPQRNGKTGLFFSFPEYGQDQEVYLDTITNYIKNNWDRGDHIAPPPGPYGIPHPGRRKVGRPKGGRGSYPAGREYHYRVALYNLRQDHPNATGAEFLDLVYADPRFNDWRVVSKDSRYADWRPTLPAITEAADKAVTWGAPDPSTASALADYALDEGSANNLWHKIFA